MAITITRKSFIEVWKKGSTDPVSSHGSPLEAVVSVLSQPPGSYEIVEVSKDISTPILEVVIPEKEIVQPEVKLTLESRDDKEYVKLGSLDITLNGESQNIVCELEFDEGDKLAVVWDGNEVGSIELN